jgi:hypothetical protein
VYAKLSPNARCGFRSWRKLCSKLARNDSTQL